MISSEAFTDRQDVCDFIEEIGPPCVVSICSHIGINRELCFTVFYEEADEVENFNWEEDDDEDDDEDEDEDYEYE